MRVDENMLRLAYDVWGIRQDRQDDYVGVGPTLAELEHVVHEVAHALALRVPITPLLSSAGALMSLTDTIIVGLVLLPVAEQHRHEALAAGATLLVLELVGHVDRARYKAAIIKAGLPPEVWDQLATGKGAQSLARNVAAVLTYARVLNL